MEIKYFVRTTGDREFDYSPLQYECMYDREHRKNISFIEQLEYISNYDAVMLEDDLLLCEDFQQKIEAVIEAHPNDIINFYYEAHNTFNKGRYFQCPFVRWNQCIYYPKGIAKTIAAAMRTFNKEELEYDLVQDMAMRKLRIPMYSSRPCLVQHIGYHSIIGNKVHRTAFIDTIYFEDYLNAANINYDDLSEDNMEQKRTLRELRDKTRRQFDSWYNSKRKNTP